MDGTRTVTQLERAVLERFGSRFAQSEDAVNLLRKTAETLTRQAPDVR